jgi:hypothetical protein
MIVDLCTDAMPADLAQWEAGAPSTEPRALDLGDGEFALVEYQGDQAWRVHHVIVWDDTIPSEQFPPLIQRAPREGELLTIRLLLGARKLTGLLQ